MRMTVPAIAALALASLQACNGPWNMEPEDPPPSSLRVSAMPLAGRTFDTIWVERIQPIDLARRGLEFVKPGSWLRIVQEDGSRRDTIVFRPASGTPRAWTTDSKVVAAYGAKLFLQGRIVWNSAPDFPAGDRTAESEISASATLPARYALRKEALAPLDALFATLSSGGDPGSASELLAALLREDSARVRRHSVGLATCDSFRQGRMVFRRIRSGDTLWAVQDDRVVEGTRGSEIKRSLRPILVAQDVDRGHWGGLVSSVGFEPGRAFVLGPIQRVEFEIRGDWNVGYDDSVRMFQPGNSVMLSVDAPDQPGMSGYPDTMSLPLMVLAHTGRNMVRTMAVERSYVAYHQAMMENESGAWNYSSIHGANGYFVGAAADSFEIHLRAVRDTFAMDALRRTWCKEIADLAPHERAQWTYGVDCAAR
ncbi:MAG TPA: hypothetical protein PKO15_06715 [Fibrobacteria bacterium]|nr:hypothetical protein [Fibrobacteria bacterium]HOX50241.1 hypothetical protein [Fibrobacteria bacterium]